METREGSIFYVAAIPKGAVHGTAARCGHRAII